MTATRISKIRAALGPRGPTVRGWLGQGLLGKAHKMQEGLAGKQCLHNSPASSCARKYGKLPNGKKGHEPNKACGISRRQPEGCNDSKETNHSAPACATQHPLSIYSPCENLGKSFGYIYEYGGYLGGRARVADWESVPENLSGCGKLKGSLGDKSKIAS